MIPRGDVWNKPRHIRNPGDNFAELLALEAVAAQSTTSEALQGTGAMGFAVAFAAIGVVGWLAKKMSSGTSGGKSGKKQAKQEQAKQAKKGKKMQ